MLSSCPLRTPGKGLHPQTVKHHLTVLHSALQQAVRWRLLAWNPCDAVGNVKVPRGRKQAVDVDEANVLIQALKDHDLPLVSPFVCTTCALPAA